MGMIGSGGPRLNWMGWSGAPQAQSMDFSDVMKKPQQPGQGLVPGGTPQVATPGMPTAPTTINNVGDMNVPGATPPAQAAPAEPGFGMQNVTDYLHGVFGGGAGAGAAGAGAGAADAAAGGAAAGGGANIMQLLAMFGL